MNYDHLAMSDIGKKCHACQVTNGTDTSGRGRLWGTAPNMSS